VKTNPNFPKQKTFVVGKESFDMIFIPPGSFVMGTDPKTSKHYFPNELPPHKVTITKPYYMGKYPVTKGLFDVVMERNLSQSVEDKQFPAVELTLLDAKKLCDRLGKRTGVKFRLPTEAEWEYACRAGTQSAYFFGHEDKAWEIVHYAWCSANQKNDKIKSVGLLRPNPWGLYDMLGNVAEWCDEESERYSHKELIDPHVPSEVTGVVRGGGCVRDIHACRCAFRQGYSSFDFAVHDVGFRLALSATE
jgi:formylglycine-generating enzyme required for sulfatase activity